MSAPVLVWTDELMIDHDPTHGVRHAHPERPARLSTLLELLEEPGMRSAIERRQPTLATAEELARVHAWEHVESLLALADQRQAIDPDTSVSPGSIQAARLAAGALLGAVRTVCANEREAARALCLVRPPGHHAEPDRAMGFCLFSNVALAAAAARAEGLAERVLILDWDVHHGNGTQAAFYEREDVLFFDLHQHPHYPGTGALDERGRGAGAGYTLNCPLPAGFGDHDYVAVFDRLLPEVAARFEPDLVLVSAGFDAHADDPLGGMCISSPGFAQLCARVQAVADEYANGRLVLSLEGGYELAALRESVRGCVEVLAGGEAPKLDGQAAPQTGAFVDALARAQLQSS